MAQRYRETYLPSCRTILVNELMPDNVTEPPELKENGPGRPRKKRFRKHTVLSQIKQNSKRKNPKSRSEKSQEKEKVTIEVSDDEKSDEDDTNPEAEESLFVKDNKPSEDEVIRRRHQEERTSIEARNFELAKRHHGIDNIEEYREFHAAEIAESEAQEQLEKVR